MIKLLWISMFVALIARADEILLQETDFSASQEIETSGAGPLFRLPLSESIYGRVTRQDLGDIRIFNADGSIVPHSFQLRTSERVQGSSTSALSFFPVEGSESSTSGDSEIILTENASGRSARVRLSGKVSKAKDVRVGYLIDLREQKAPLKSLTIDWESQRKNGIVTINISSSDDLRNWSPVESGVALAHFAFKGQNLEKNLVELQGVQAKFLKITWAQDPTFVVKGIEGEFASGGWLEAKRSQTNVPCARAEGLEYHFEKALFTADRVSVQLPEENTVVRVTLSSRSDPKSGWYPRFMGPVYRIHGEQGEIVSGPEKISPTSDRYWRLLVEGKEASLGKTNPTLVFGWVTHHLYFLARGKGPFRIAFGNPKARTPDFGFNSIVDLLPGQENNIEPQVARLVGEERVLVQPGPVVEVPTFPWKKYVLWACLAAALALSTFMAWKLYSELNKT